MKKFKIKNRQKRKYVKKHELSASYAFAQSLTVGLVPLVLMAIAFFATIIMTTPHLLVPNLPQVSITLPAMPEITLPEITLPEVQIPQPQPPQVRLPEMPEMPKVSIPKISVPTITVPNPFPYMAAFFAEVSYALTTWWTDTSVALVQAFSAFGSSVVVGFERLGAMIVSGTRIVGETMYSAISFIVRSYINGVINIVMTLQVMVTVTVDAFITVAVFLYELAIEIARITIAWIQTAIVAIIEAWNAFVWFIGTPFRALHAYSVEVGILLAPYMQFLSVAFEQATSDLGKGGENLVNGTMYVTETVEHNQQRD